MDTLVSFFVGEANSATICRYVGLTLSNKNYKLKSVWIIGIWS